MKILFVCSSSNFFGGEKVLLNLAERFKQDNNDIHVILPCNGDFSKKLNEHNIEFSFVDIKNSISFNSIPAYLKVMKIFNPDIIHSHGYVSNQLSRIVSCFTKTPVISVLHVLQNYKYSELGFKAFYYRLLDQTTNFMSFKGENIAVSLPVADTASYLNPVVIANGMDYPKINYNYPEKIKNFAMVGRIVNIKGIFEVLHAFNDLKQKYEITPNLYIIGKDITPSKKWEKYFKNYVNEKKLTNIKFIDFLEDTEEIYKKFDCLIHASYEGHEGCPLVLIEAMLRKKLIIFSGIRASDFVMKEHGIRFSSKKTENFLKKLVKICEIKKNKLYNIIKKQYDFSNKEYSLEIMYKRHKKIIEENLKK